MSVLAEVADSVSLLRAERRSAEEAYGMTPSVMGHLGPLGVFRLMASDRSVSVAEYIRVLEGLAYGDPSVAWAAANSNGAASVTRLLPPELAAEMLASDNWFYGVGFPPCGTAVRKGNTLQVSGRWPVVSGCEHASYFVLNSVVRDESEPVDLDGPPLMTYVVVPKSEVVIERTWVGVNAVRGSGSHAVTIEGFENNYGRLCDPR